VILWLKNKNRKIWKVRTVESYSEAHNHLAGQLLESTDYYVWLNCKTYHFARSVNTPKDIRVGDKRARIGPWNRIEIVNELPASFDYSEAKLATNEGGKVILSHAKIKCAIASSYDSRY